MPETAALYAETLSLLRSVSDRHARTLGAMAGAAVHQGAPPPSFEVLARLGEDARRLEDEGIGAVCRLSVRSDRATAVRAVEQAGASWLLDVILNRAAETLWPGRQPAGRARLRSRRRG
jgi:hypothetical protein